MSNKCTIVSQFITLLQISTLSCYPQTVCNQYFVKGHLYFSTCTLHLLLFCPMSNKCIIISQFITLIQISTLPCHSQAACNQYLVKLQQYFSTCTLHLLLFCPMSNKCIIISQFITLLQISTLLCHSQTACNQYLVKLHKYFKHLPCILYYFALWQTNAFLSQIITLLHISIPSCHSRRTCNQYFAKLHKYLNTCTVHLLLHFSKTNNCKIISQIITLLYVSTLWCHLQTACNQYLASLHKYFFTCTVYPLLFCTMSNKCIFITQIITLLNISTISCHPQTAWNQYLAKLHQYFFTSTMHHLLFCTMINKCKIISQIITLLHVSTLLYHTQTACS